MKAKLWMVAILLMECLEMVMPVSATKIALAQIGDDEVNSDSTSDSKDSKLFDSEFEDVLLNDVAREDFYLAAVTLVDVAIYCRRAKCRSFWISKETRLALIESIFNEPYLTAHLFTLDEFPLH